MTLETTPVTGATEITSAPEALANELGAANPDTTAQTDEKTPDPEADHKRSLSKLQRRVDNVTRARYEAEARAQQLAERAERAERELLQSRQAAQPNEPTTTPVKQPGPQDIEARANEIALVRETTAKANAIADAGKKAFGDAFGDLVSVVQEEAGPLYQRNGLPTALGEAITDSDNPSALLHHLGQNPELAEELKGLSPAQLGRRIARIEAAMPDPTAQAASKAPVPPNTPKGGGGSTGEPSPSSPDYMAWKLKKLNGR